MSQPSAKELKELKKQQKQAQRAARKEQGTTAGSGHAPQGPHAAQSGADSGHGSHPGVGGGASGPNNNSGRPVPTYQAVSGAQASQTGNGNAFGQYAPLNLFSGIDAPKAIVSTKSVHPAILHLALQMQSCRIIGSTLRCKAMMQAFEQVICDYETPPHSTLSRSLAVHFSHQIEVLKSGRGLSVSMGNAIRWLKQETSELPIDMPDHEAKARLIELIRVFVRDRLDVADTIIVENASSHVRDEDDVILTYGMSHVVLETLVYAHVNQKKRFRVIVADSPPLFEGKKAAASLVAVGIPTTYILISALPYVIKGVTTLMVGAHAMVSNGNLYSRVGTALVAVMAAARGIPVLVLCETIKFSDRVQLDAFAMNEFIPSSDAPGSGNTNSVYFDLTDQKFISKVITEVGALPASSVPVILREYKQVL